MELTQPDLLADPPRPAAQRSTAPPVPRVSLRPSTVSLYHITSDATPQTAPTLQPSRGPFRSLPRLNMTPLAHDSSAPRGWTQEHSSVLSPAFYQSTGPRRLQRPQQHCGRPSSAASSGSRLPPPSVALPHPTPELAQSFSMLPIGMPAHVPSAAALFAGASDAAEALQSPAAWPPAVAGGAERPAEQPSAALILGLESSFAAAPSTPPGGGSVEAGQAAAPPAGRQLSPVPSAALRRLEKKRTSTCVHQQKHEAHAQQVREPVLRALRGVPYFAQVAAEHDEALLACAAGGIREGSEPPRAPAWWLPGRPAAPTDAGAPAPPPGGSRRPPQARPKPPQRRGGPDDGLPRTAFDTLRAGVRS